VSVSQSARGEKLTLSATYVLGNRLPITNASLLEEAFSRVLGSPPRSHGFAATHAPLALAGGLFFPTSRNPPQS
jgi:hypothetical protein